MRLCNICNSVVEVEHVLDYPFYCKNCDENLYEFETHMSEFYVKHYTLVWHDEKWTFYTGIVYDDDLILKHKNGFSAYFVAVNDKGIIMWDDWNKDNFKKSFSEIYGENVFEEFKLDESEISNGIYKGR